jgi:transposase-like protein
MRKSCPTCGYPLVKNGSRKLKYRQDVQRWRCRNPERWHFWCDSDFPRMRFPREVVRSAVSLRRAKLTLRDVLEQLEVVFEKVPRAISTAWLWAQRFVALAEQPLRNLGERLHADETKIRTRRKGEFFWLWTLKCPATKAIVAWHVSLERDSCEARRLFWNARRAFPPNYRPKEVVTDGWPGYGRAMRTTLGQDVRHIVAHIPGNNEMENWYRCKRGLTRFRTLAAARNFFSNHVAVYNMMRRHSSLGKAPAELCGAERLSWAQLIKIWPSHQPRIENNPDDNKAKLLNLSTPSILCPRCPKSRLS